MTPNICFYVFAHVRHILQNFGTCTYGAVPSRVLTATPLEPVTLSPKILIFSTPPRLAIFQIHSTPPPPSSGGDTMQRIIRRFYRNRGTLLLQLFHVYDTCIKYIQVMYQMQADIFSRLQSILVANALLLLICFSREC